MRRKKIAQTRDGRKNLACATGTYYLQSDELPLEYEGLPAFTASARLLMPNLYAGKVLKPECDEAPVLLGFVWADEAGNFVGGISDPVRVQFVEDGSMTIKKDEPQITQIFTD